MGLKYPIAAAVVIIAVLVVWIAGGFAKPELPGVPTVDMRTPMPGAPWLITVTDSVWVARLDEAVVPTTRGDRLILVAVDLESTATDVPSSWRNAVSLTGVAGLRDAKPMLAVRRDDETPVTDIGPGLPATVTIVWQQDGTLRPPTSPSVRDRSTSARRRHRHRHRRHRDRSRVRTSLRTDPGRPTRRPPAAALRLRGHGRRSASVVTC